MNTAAPNPNDVLLAKSIACSVVFTVVIAPTGPNNSSSKAAIPGSTSLNKVIGKKFPFINVGSGSDISIKDLAGLISRIVGFKGKMIFDKSKPDGTFRKLMDNTKLRKIKWKPKISLNSGIKKTIEDFKATI